MRNGHGSMGHDGVPFRLKLHQHLQDKADVSGLEC
jgi:hypothetical protein